MNRRVGWLSLVAGIATGLVMGLWSFDGPLAPPAWLGGYADTPRRLARLGHIAFIGLGILNLLLAHELPQSALGPTGRRVAARAMNAATFFYPSRCSQRLRGRRQVRHGVAGDVRIRRAVPRSLGRAGCLQPTCHWAEGPGGAGFAGPGGRAEPPLLLRSETHSKGVFHR